MPAQEMPLGQQCERAGSCCQDPLAPWRFRGSCSGQGEGASQWHIAFGMPNSGKYHTRSEPFTIPSWSIQAEVCSDPQLAHQGEIWGALMDEKSQMESFCLSLGLVVFWLGELAPELLLGSGPQSPCMSSWSCNSVNPLEIAETF